MQRYFIRHGRTNYNDLGLCNSDPAVPVHLTPTGISQAERAEERLRPVPLQRIFVSELPRARQTAEIINRHHQVAILVHPALNDIRSGCENRPVRKYQAAIAHDPLRAKVGNGESLLEYKARVVTFLQWLDKQPLEVVAVVAHEETLRIIYGHYHQLDDKALPALRFANCEIVKIED
jgi:broad specificity phosphatase PhoE